jgi:cytochrome c-type biogenesis protein
MVLAMGLEVSIGGAFLAGLLSFLSPCVLPLVPPYLCYITGYTLDDLADRKDEARVNSVEVVIAALLFVAGFSAVFVTMGATASAIGQVLRDHMALLAKLSGVVIILMGLHFLGVFRIGLLYRQAQFQPEVRQASLVGAFVIGLAFGFGWTPCIGPILAVILAIAASTDSVGQGTAFPQIPQAIPPACAQGRTRDGPPARCHRHHVPHRLDPDAVLLVSGAVSESRDARLSTTGSP